MGLDTPLSSNTVLNSESIIAFHKMTNHLLEEECDGTFTNDETIRVFGFPVHCILSGCFSLV
jgi:hypothetical protein